MPSSVWCGVKLAICCGLVLILCGAARAQSYSVTYLDSNLTGKAKHLDTLLLNPWGIAYAPGGAFWVADEKDGWSTLYDGSGNPQSLQVIVPPSSGTGPGKPTGLVYNGSTEFAIDTWVSVFLFSTLDGTISGWSNFDPSTALIAVRQAGAKFTGLAITNHPSGNFLYAADFANNRVDVYDGSFNLVKSFTDSTIPAGFAPFGIEDIAGQVYVAYASTAGGVGGYIDIFGEDGTFVKRFAQGTPLNQPWGLTLAPKNFGPMSGALLVSNNVTAGNINAFTPLSGKSVGALKNSAGTAIAISGLWGIEFGGGSILNGKTNQLFFAAGPSDFNGIFGVINPVP